MKFSLNKAIHRWIKKIFSKELDENYNSKNYKKYKFLEKIISGWIEVLEELSNVQEVLTPPPFPLKHTYIL